MTTSNALTKNDLKSIFENIYMATFAYGRGEVGEIKAYAGSTIPAGWLLCNGQAVSRTDYSELFSVIGTTYGEGNGLTTFNVPDLRGRFPIGIGTGTATDATERTLGQSGGSERVTLNIDQLPAHTHGYQKPVLMYGSGGNSTWPAAGTSAMGSDTWGYSGVASTGGGQSHGNMPPYLGLNYIIFAKSTVTVASPSIDLFYPVGSYYETSDSTFDPNNQWGGAWILVTKDSVTFSSGSNVTIPATTETKMCTINLDAGKRYLLIGTAGAGSAASAVSSSNIGVQSGTYNYFYNCGVNSATASAGRTLSAMAYIETNTACVAYISKYNYGSSAISTAWGHIVAIPLINLQDGNYKWHRTA